MKNKLLIIILSIAIIIIGTAIFIRMNAAFFPDAVINAVTGPK